LIDGGGTISIIFIIIGAEIMFQSWKILKITQSKIRFHNVFPFIQLAITNSRSQEGNVGENDIIGVFREIYP